MKVQKTLATPFQPNCAPICGFETYIDPSRRILMRRLGWETGDDVHENFVDQISRDNGQTWEAAQSSLNSRKVDGGYVYYIEFGTLRHSSGKFVVVTNEKFQKSLDHADMEGHGKLHITEYNVSEEGLVPCGAPLVTNFGLTQPMVSFCTPIEDSRARILVPISRQKQDRDGKLRELGIRMRPDMPDIAVDWGEIGLLIGEVGESGIEWRLGGFVPMNPENSSRGLYEGALAELADGRLAYIMRGSNGPGPVGGPKWQDKPGYKWCSISRDGGETWSEAQPLACDDGSLLESSASGSVIFRSIKNNKLYWLGNLCVDGQRPFGNFPRTPLLLAQMQEEPFALVRDSIAVVDKQGPDEDAFVQMSNFKFYQDVETGDLVFYLTRYGEYGSENNKWLESNQYQYRVSIDE